MKTRCGPFWGAGKRIPGTFCAEWRSVCHCELCRTGKTKHSFKPAEKVEEATASASASKLLCTGRARRQVKQWIGSGGPRHGWDLAELFRRDPEHAEQILVEMYENGLIRPLEYAPTRDQLFFMSPEHKSSPQRPVYGQLRHWFWWTKPHSAPANRS